ncbi:hypothetical protein V2V90_00090 [Agrobacterium leguminum]|uniref:hypothetical protein n=1 Tax=Agrobacterium leguminum TaxID=2792015 RepID=UPI0030D32733
MPSPSSSVAGYSSPHGAVWVSASGIRQVLGAAVLPGVVVIALGLDTGFLAGYAYASTGHPSNSGCSIGSAPPVARPKWRRRASAPPRHGRSCR